MLFEMHWIHISAANGDKQMRKKLKVFLGLQLSSYKDFLSKSCYPQIEKKFEGVC